MVLLSYHGTVVAADRTTCNGPAETCPIGTEKQKRFEAVFKALFDVLHMSEVTLASALEDVGPISMVARKDFDQTGMHSEYASQAEPTALAKGFPNMLKIATAKYELRCLQQAGCTPPPNGEWDLKGWDKVTTGDPQAKAWLTLGIFKVRGEEMTNTYFNFRFISIETKGLFLIINGGWE